MRHSKHPVLNSGHIISVVTDDLGLADLSNFGQLFGREGGREARILEPKAITAPNVGKLSGHNARKSWANNGVWQTLFRYSTTPQVNIVRMSDCKDAKV